MRPRGIVERRGTGHLHDVLLFNNLGQAKTQPGEQTAGPVVPSGIVDGSALGCLRPYRDDPAGSTHTALPGSIAELLDFSTIPQPKPWTTHQAAGDDRDGGFYDSGHFLRTEPGRRYLLMESDGPGVIDRMWFTCKGEPGTEPYNLLVFLDDLEQPAIACDLDGLFAGRREPFVPPLAGRCGNPRFPGRFSLVPLGFARSARVALQPTAPPALYHYRENRRGETIPHVYYQVTFRRLPTGDPVRPFSWRLEPAERNALARWEAVCAQAGRSPWPEEVQTNRITWDLEILPGRTAVLVEWNGPGVLAGIRLRTDRIADLELRCHWDGTPEPAVACPLGPFFGCAATRTATAAWCSITRDALALTPDLNCSARNDLQETPTEFPSPSFSSLPCVKRTEGNEGNEERRRGI
jgi:hypothetical protein